MDINLNDNISIQSSSMTVGRKSAIYSFNDIGGGIRHILFFLLTALQAKNTWLYTASLPSNNKRKKKYYCYHRKSAL